MNFSKLSKEKKNQLVLVALVTLMLLVGLGYGLIRFQLDYVTSLEKQKVDAERNLKKMDAVIASKKKVQNELERALAELAAQEDAMISGDKLKMLVNTIKQALREHPKLAVPDYSTIQEENCTLLAKFPYSQVTIGIKGTGHYHDLGRFLADFENRYPHYRVVNLELQATQKDARETKDRPDEISFQFQVVALVKPTTS